MPFYSSLPPLPLGRSGVPRASSYCVSTVGLLGEGSGILAAGFAVTATKLMTELREWPTNASDSLPTKGQF